MFASVTTDALHCSRQDESLKVDVQRPHNQVMHSVIGMGGVIQILIKISRFSAEILIKGPAQARKRTVLVETGLTAKLGRVSPNEKLVPSDQA